MYRDCVVATVSWYSDMAISRDAPRVVFIAQFMGWGETLVSLLSQSSEARYGYIDTHYSVQNDYAAGWLRGDYHHS